MSKQRRQYSAALKSKVALEAIKGVRSMNEIATHYGVHPNQVGQWKKQALEAFLARIYVDAQAREEFLNDPAAEALKAGLSEDEIEALKQIDQVGLELLAVSLERKRQWQYTHHHSHW